MFPVKPCCKQTIILEPVKFILCVFCLYSDLLYYRTCKCPWYLLVLFMDHSFGRHMLKLGFPTLLWKRGVLFQKAYIMILVELIDCTDGKYIHYSETPLNWTLSIMNMTRDPISTYYLNNPLKLQFTVCLVQKVSSLAGFVLKSLLLNMICGPKSTLFLYR